MLCDLAPALLRLAKMEEARFDPAPRHSAAGRGISPRGHSAKARSSVGVRALQALGSRSGEPGPGGPGRQPKTTNNSRTAP
ncbi:MAG: hypothetical protein ACRDVP_04125 [Acidimicrobiales bacterium]